MNRTAPPSDTVQGFDVNPETNTETLIFLPLPHKFSPQNFISHLGGATVPTALTGYTYARNCNQVQ